MVKLIIPDKKKKGEIESNVPISIMKYIYNHYDQLTRYFSNLTFKALK